MCAHIKDIFISFPSPFNNHPPTLQHNTPKKSNEELSAAKGEELTQHRTVLLSFSTLSLSLFPPPPMHHKRRKDMPAWARTRTPSPSQSVRTMSSPLSTPAAFAYPSGRVSEPRVGVYSSRVLTPPQLHSEMDECDSTGAPTDPGLPPTPRGRGVSLSVAAQGGLAPAQPTAASPVVLRSVSPPASRRGAHPSPGGSAVRRSNLRTASPAQRGGQQQSAYGAYPASTSTSTPILRGASTTPPASPRTPRSPGRSVRRRKGSPRTPVGMGMGMQVQMQQQQQQHQVTLYEKQRLRSLEKENSALLAEGDSLREDLVSAHRRISQLTEELRMRDEQPPPSPVHNAVDANLRAMLLQKDTELGHLQQQNDAIASQAAALQAQLDLTRRPNKAVSPPSPSASASASSSSRLFHVHPMSPDTLESTAFMAHHNDEETKRLRERERTVSEREMALEVKTAQIEVDWKELEQMKTVVRNAPSYSAHLLAQKQTEFEEEMQRREDKLHEKTLELTAWEKRLGGTHGSRAVAFSPQFGSPMPSTPSRQMSPPPSQKKATWSLSG